MIIRIITTAAAAAILAMGLSACNGMTGLGALSGTDQTAILNAVNAHIEGCERHYHGQTVPPSLSVQIDCPANKPAAAAVPVTVATPAPQ